MARKKKLKKKRVIIFSVILIIVILIGIISFSFRNKKDKVQIDKDVVANEKDEQQIILSTVENMNERNRMEYYFSVFINYLEDEDYEKAYNLLYDEFKKNYFPTLKDFEEYAKKTFPKMINVEHENLERNGDVYVLWIYISDLVNGGPNDKKAMNVVIKENDLNDFVMSFSVI